MSFSAQDLNDNPTQSTQSNPAPSPAAAPAAPAQTGGFSPADLGQTKPLVDTPSQESWSDRWAREASETIGKAVPQFMTGPMSAFKNHVTDKFSQSARELGNIAEHKVNTFLGYADQAMSDLDADLSGKKVQHEPIPAYAKGLEGAYTENKFETESPITSGVTGGLANLGGQILGDPTNWPFLAKGLVKSIGGVTANGLKPWAEKLMSKGFGIQMTKGVYDQLEELASHWPGMNAYQRSKAITQVIAGTYMAQSAVREGFGDEPKSEAPQTVGPEQGGEGPLKSTQTGTVAGEKTTLRPTTRTTAGVEAPVSAEAAATLEGEKPGLLNRTASALTSPIAERNFGKEQVAPAATRQAVSTIGQVAEDAINNHKAVVEGEGTPEQITGTQQVSRFLTPDEAWQDMQKTAQETTYRTADDISQREQSKWQAERDRLVQEYKDSVDRHNANIDDYNAQVEAKDRMPHAVFDPSEVNVPERPKTFNEMRAEVEQAKSDAKSGDSAIREEGRKNLKKAQNAMDGWFRGHADEISPAEYESVQRLWSQSERMKEIAMKLRGSLAKGALTGNKMRDIEVAMNNQQIRAGQQPDAFQRLLGPDGYNNWQNVAKLFDTVKDPSLPEMFKSWGAYATEYVVSALLPHLSGLGIAAKWGAEKFLNHVMFDPEFGSTFNGVVDWLKSRGGLVAQSITELPSTLRDKFVGVIKAYEDSKAGSERGAAGAGVKQGSTPEPRKFGRSGIGGPTSEDVKAASNPQRDTDLLAQVRAEMPNASLSEQLMEAARRANPKSVSGGAAVSPAQEIVHPSIAADAYNKSTGRLPLNQEKVSVDSRKADIADAYDAMKHDPNDPRVKQAYEALIQESKAQKKHLEDQGYTFSRSATDPYKSFEEMRDDVQKNKHLSVWTGGNPFPKGHPLAEIDPETGWRHNDIMRVVHDFMGHAAGDNDFSEKGEENAYNLHKQSFSERAIPALTTETKGQTSWFFNNKAVRNGGELGTYAEQKAGILPEHTYQTDHAQSIADITNANGGATYNPTRGSMTGQDAYAVPMFPELSRTVVGTKVTPAQIETYMRLPEVRAALRANPRLNIGTWVNDGKVYLDLSLAIPDRETAIRVGTENGQKAITYLKDLSEISLGKPGTGTSLESPMSDALVSKYGKTEDPTKAGFILPNGDMVPLVGEHDRMLQSAGAQGAREDIIAKENAIRMRSYQTKAGRKVTFSIPDKVTEDQINQIRAAVKQFGPDTVLGIEQGKPGGDFRTTAISGDKANAPTVNKFLRELDAIDTNKQVADMKAKVDAEKEKQQALQAPQPVYIDRKNGFHEVVTGPASDRVGHLLAQDVPSEKEGEPSTEVRVSTHWVADEMRGKGFGASQLEEMAKSLADSGKTALLSDTKMTDSAKGAWKRLMANYPIAVTETPEGYRFDLEKLKAPAVTKTTSTVKGSTVELMKNPLPVKSVSAESSPTVDVAVALNKYTKRNLGALKPGSDSAEMVARAKEIAEDEARYQLSQNNSGTTWYTEQMDEHDTAVREMRPALKDDTKLSLFKFAEAILSSGQKPYGNFKAAVRAWDHYAENGSFSGTNPETGKSWGPRGIPAYASAFDMLNRLIEERGEKGTVDWMMKEHPVSELKQYNKWVSGKKSDMRPGVLILGEKRGPFAQNLHGMETAFTADMWVSRTWNRWMGTIEIAPDGELASDSPRNQQERALMKQSFSEVAQNLGLTTSSLQAVLWYYEQALYSAHGTPKESWSFSDAARRAQAEEKANAPEKPAPELEGPSPRERAGRFRDKDTEFNPSDFTENPKSGVPRTIQYVRNPEKASDFGERFAQHLEPAGRYLNESSGYAPKGWETGTVHFQNPLVLDWGTGYQSEGGWKQQLSRRYGGKTGAALSKAIRADGYDGIITVDGDSTSEIVDLTKM